MIEVQIQKSYQGKEVYVGIYNSEEKLLDVSQNTLVTVIDMEFDPYNGNINLNK